MLIIIDPGIKQFGEDKGNDALIRKFGYIGMEEVLELMKDKDDLKNNQSAAARLIHGCTNGRFSVTYAVDKLSKEEVESVNLNYMTIDEAYAKYDIMKLRDGYNILDNGEEIYYISNPALGLWADKNRF